MLHVLEVLRGFVWNLRGAPSHVDSGIDKGGHPITNGLGYGGIHCSGGLSG